MEEEQTHADGDGGIGHIEGGPMPGFPVNIKKVRDRAVSETVDQISERAAPDEGNPNSGPGALGGQLFVHFDEESQDDHREPDEKLVGLGENAKGRPRILHVGQGEARQERNRMAEGKKSFHDDL